MKDVAVVREGGYWVVVVFEPHRTKRYRFRSQEKAWAKEHQIVTGENVRLFKKHRRMR